jgi:hypothetical protein
MSDLLVSDEHPTSKRHAIVAGEGDSVWLYLTGPGGKPILADCWLWNRGPALDRVAWTARAAEARARSGPPPAPAVVLRNEAVPGRSNEPSTFRFQWNAEGDTVSVWSDNELLGTVLAGERRGYSAGVAIECAWGRPVEVTDA